MTTSFDKPEIGLGIIGLGMGRVPLAACDAPDSTMRVRALCDINTELLQTMSQQHRVDQATTDYRELIQSPDVDVVCIYSPDPLHFGHIMAALEAGKHVICTKPMVTNLKDACTVLDAVRSSGLKFLVGQTCRFIPAFMAAKRLAEQNAYGRMLYVEATYNHDLRDTFDYTPWRYQMPQDFLFGGLCHPMDLALWVGGRVQEVSAFSSASQIDSRYPSDYPDNFLVNLRFENGAIGRVVGLYGGVHAEGMPSIELTISGTEAASHQDEITWQNQDGQRRVESINETLPVAHEGTEYGGHGGEVARYLWHFEKCLRQGRTPVPGALEATRVSAALEAVRTSAATGRTEEVAWIE